MTDENHISEEKSEVENDKHETEERRVKNVIQQIQPEPEEEEEEEFVFSESIPMPKKDSANNIFLCGPTGTGKTNFAMHLINNEWVVEDENKQKKSIFDMIAVMSSTAGSNPQYSLVFGQDFLKDMTYLTPEFDEELLENMMSDELVEARKLVYIDDFGYDDVIMKSKILRKLITTGRHDNITVIVNVQDYFQLDPEVRGNVKWVAFWQLNKKERVDKLCKEFETVHYTDDVIRQIYQEATSKPYGFLWIHMTQPRAFYDSLDVRFSIKE